LPLGPKRQGSRAARRDDPTSLTSLRHPSDTYFIVLPGGGYAAHGEHEAEPIVDWLSGLGVAAGVLHYPLLSRHPAPLEAVRTHIRDLRERGVERIGVIGFSAGGHLAGLAALSAGSNAETWVDLAILGYPITSMLTETYRPARLILLGEDATPRLRRATSLDTLVTRAAPPFFIWHTAEDPFVPVEHSYLLASALARHDVSHALHVFSHGPHSLGLAHGAGEPAVWTKLAAAWLGDRLG
jgi:acetyl esterase/lipase